MRYLYTNDLLCGIDMVPKVSGLGKFCIEKKRVTFLYLQKYSLKPHVSSINFAVNFKCEIVITNPSQKKKG